MVETECELCGNCVSACPTGALQDKLSRLQGRTWDTTAGRLRVHLLRLRLPHPAAGQGRPRRAGRPRASATGPGQGNLCVKGRYGFQFIGHPERLTTPLVRRDGELVAGHLGRGARRWSRGASAEVRDAHGADAVAGFSSARCTNEENYLFQKFMRAVIGTNNVDHCARLCHASTVTGLRQSLGSGAMTNSFDDLETADAVLVIGSNTTESHPIAALRIKKAQRRGAKLIVADPRAIDMARRADLHLQLRPAPTWRCSTGSCT